MPVVLSKARTCRALLLGTAVALVAIGAGPGAVALAAPAEIRITSPRSGSVTNNTAPVIAGTTNETSEEPGEGEEIEVTLHSSEGTEQHLRAVPAPDGTWSVAPAALAPGSYTARAAPVIAEEGAGFDEVTFTVDTTPPAITLSAPLNGSSTTGGSVAVAGTAGTASGDLPSINVALYAGDGSGALTLLETLGVQAAGETWSGTFGGLAPGTYTVQASQSDEAGNTGTSATTTFTITTPSGSAGPVASFIWVPTAPVVGESVALVSSSTDSASAITGFEWAFTPSAPFSAGKPVLTTSFSTAGAHVVRLRVTDAAGRSSVATETVPVKGQPSVLMSPFPIVRIAGSVTGRGARIRLLTVQAPVSSVVRIHCRGDGCRTKPETRSAKVSSNGKHTAAVLLSFRHFERSYRARTVLEIAVVKAGQIGKYTRFAIRRHKLPVRFDACLPAIGAKPVACASS